MYNIRLRELRLEHGYTMEQVGTKIGIKKSSYASYESKHRQPPLERLRQLSEVYDVSVDYILGITDKKKDSQSKNIRCVLKQKGLHWDGVPLHDDVLEKILTVLENTNRKMDRRRIEG